MGQYAANSCFATRPYRKQALCALRRSVARHWHCTASRRVSRHRRPRCTSPNGTAEQVPTLSNESDESSSISAWFPLEQLIWEGTEADAMLRGTGAHPSWASVSPPWKVMLLSDGSVTRHLQLLTDLHVVVDCMEMRNIGECLERLPKEAELLHGPIVQRQVDNYLKDSSKPIWVSLSEGRTELYREIKRLYYGHSQKLEAAFQCKGPFWARHYLFWHNGKPLTLIYEVFSGSLEEYLGPANLVTQCSDPLSSIEEDQCLE